MIFSNDASVNSPLMHNIFFATGGIGQSKHDEDTISNDSYKTKSLNDDSNENYSKTKQKVKEIVKAPKSNPEIHSKFKKLDEIINKLEEVEIDTDISSASSNTRTESLALFGRIVETILILLAVQHTGSLTRTSENIVLVPLLFLLVYLTAQLNYALSHWGKLVSLAKRRISQRETSEVIQKQKYMERKANNTQSAEQ